jgi:hypothetical protein
MKKIIISIMTVVIGVSLFTTAAHADASFNSPGQMATVTVTNGTTQPCNFGAIDGCWKSSTTASPGDMIAVHLYFKNTSSETATGVTLGIEPSRSGTNVTFNGGVAASNAPRATGTATVTLSQVETITNMSQSGPYQADWYPSATSAAQPVDTDELFGSGFPIGSMAPGAQGVLVVRFLVNGTATVTPPPAASCEINNFSANPTSIALGSTSALSWTTQNCNYVDITQVGTNLATDNSGYTVSPTNTTTYTLTAYPDGGTATATVTVTNNTGGGGTTNACSINNFTASPNSITSGGSSSLNWNTTNCNYVNITSVGNSLAADGSQTVYPANTTTYTLTAYPGGTTATTTVTVNTVSNNSCYINNFTASPSSISYGGSSNLSWSTSNCNYVNISTLSGNQSTSGNVSVYPDNTTTYELTAYPGGSTSTVTVNVYSGGNNNYCSISSFYVDSNSITQGSSTVLHWNTSGADSVYISGFGSENSSGSLPISPYSSTTYTLSLNGSNCSGNQSQSVYVTVSQPIQVQQTGEQPQAITTVASVLSSYSAQLNGIAVPNNQYGTTTAWFEYGSSTALGNTTSPQQINAGLGTNPYSGNISGLAPGGTYYYRAVVQNQYGTAYGSIVPFSTPAATSYTYTPPTRVIVQSRTVTTGSSGLVANSTPSLFKLEVDSNFDHMCIGGNISYTVNYENISSQTLQNTVLRITFPGELTYASSSDGDYDVTDRTLTIALGDMQPGQTGSVTVNAQVNSDASVGKLSVITATIVYTNPTTQAQEQAIAYSLITVSNDCPSVLGASVFGFGSFLPQTLLAWLLLILIILALIVLARTLTKKNEPAK